MCLALDVWLKFLDMPSKWSGLSHLRSAVDSMGHTEVCGIYAVGCLVVHTSNGVVHVVPQLTQFSCIALGFPQAGRLKIAGSGVSAMNQCVFTKL